MKNFYLKFFSVFVANSLFAKIVLAQAAATKQPSIVETFVIPMGGLLLIMYFLVIRPQQKKAQETASMLQSLKPGDEVLTSGGLIGRVKSISEGFLNLDLGSTTVKVLKSHVTGLSKTKDVEAQTKK